MDKEIKKMRRELGYKVSDDDDKNTGMPETRNAWPPSQWSDVEADNKILIGKTMLPV